MPQLTFQVTAAGLAAPVWIGLDGKTSTALIAAGQAIAPPVQARGLLDTGSDVTAVAPWVLQRLALRPSAKTVTHTASGPTMVNVYEISLGITDPNQSGGPWMTLTNLLVTELAAPLADADVLVGLDVLLQCRLLLDGPTRVFSLDF
jgi:hypothetical protein